ncbi:MAG: hypothetical protein MZV63_14950 [Marinilabiliales bacterium]|nr:hypothetical protein [Marinilabiliales bacterium]
MMIRQIADLRNFIYISFFMMSGFNGVRRDAEKAVGVVKRSFRHSMGVMPLSSGYLFRDEVQEEGAVAFTRLG